MRSWVQPGTGYIMPLPRGHLWGSTNHRLIRHQKEVNRSSTCLDYQYYGLRQEVSEFKASLRCIKAGNSGSRCDPSIQEAEAGGSRPVSLKPV